MSLIYSELSVDFNLCLRGSFRLSDVCVCVCACGGELRLYSKGAELRILYYTSKQFVDKECDIQKDCFF
jgi:hypothetical protein